MPQVVVAQREVQNLVVKHQHGDAGGGSGREEESVFPELDASRHCGGDPRGGLENELVDAKTFCDEVRDVRGVVKIKRTS